MSSPTDTRTASNVLASLGFAALSEGISWYEPTSDQRTRRSKTDPTLIIICSWAFARPKHIAKYLGSYQSIYPGTTILLVQNAIANMVWRPDNWQWGFFESATTAIQSHIGMTDSPRVLLHVFSNGGSHGAVQLSQACRVNCGGLRMPVDAIVLDSCPGQPRFQATITALTLGIPSNNPAVLALGTALAYLVAGSTPVLSALNIAEPAAWKLWRKLNDPTDAFLLGKNKVGKKIAKPRTYIYSESDMMIMAVDVEDHARSAQSTLATEGLDSEEAINAIVLERFVGTAHVNHVKGDGELYWKTVKDTWRRAS